MTVMGPYGLSMSLAMIQSKSSSIDWEVISSQRESKDSALTCSLCTLLISQILNKARSLVR